MVDVARCCLRAKEEGMDGDRKKVFSAPRAGKSYGGWIRGYARYVRVVSGDRREAGEIAANAKRDHSHVASHYVVAVSDRTEAMGVGLTVNDDVSQQVVRASSAVCIQDSREGF